MAPIQMASRQLSRAALVASRRSLATAVSAHDFEAGEVAGIKYAALDGGKRACAITVALKAGPRYETTAGVAHLLKNSLFKVSALPPESTQLLLTAAGISDPRSAATCV